MRQLYTKIDIEGFRANVALVIFNTQYRVLLAKRIGQDAWQFPQGGVKPYETVKAAMYRELWEEVGLLPQDVELISISRGWYQYRLPRKYIRRHSRPVCIGQKQRWCLLKFKGDDSDIKLDVTRRPEFDDWRWAEYSEPSEEVIYFKQDVYKRALSELHAPYVKNYLHWFFDQQNVNRP